MMPKPHIVWTREQLIVLDKHETLTMREMATLLHKSVGTVHRWCALLGNVKNYPSLEPPTYTGAEPKCAVCGIILAEADAMDGPGSDTTCLFCLTVERGLPWGAPYLPSCGGDITPGVYDTVACARKVLNGVGERVG